jgi:hypothetical protein
MAGTQQGLKVSGLWGRGVYPGELWDWLQAGVWHRLIAGIPMVMGPAAWPGIFLKIENRI